MEEDDFPLLTRKQIVERIREKYGIPMTESRLEKASASGEGPQPAATYGRRQLLYRASEAEAWAKTLVKPVARAPQTRAQSGEAHIDRSHWNMAKERASEGQS